MGAAPSTSSLSGQLRIAVLRLSRRLRQEAAGEITASQMSALYSVAKAGNLSLGELATIERVAPPSMTRIASRLEQEGLVQRVAHVGDRRVVRIELTELGEKLLAETRVRGDAFLAERLAGFSEEEAELLAQAVGLLERLAHDARKPDEV
ncbi:MAG: MarR family winged helix-turn-helix transcriptional regulator [Acidimicrobiales bacterium]